MTSGDLPIGFYQLRYQKSGSGSRILLAFHGFGENAGSFYPVMNSLEKCFTVYSIEFPFHGNSPNTAHDEKWQASDFLQAIIMLLKEIKADTCYLTGYSMGGRIALSIYEAMPARIAGIFLFAADGLRPNTLFTCSTGTKAGRILLKWVMNHPAPFMQCVKVCRRLGWIQKPMADFGLKQVATVQQRQKIYRTWVLLAQFKVHLPAIRNSLSLNPIPVALIYGKHDKIIPAATARQLEEGLDSVTVYLVDKGHRLLTPDLNGFLEDLFLEWFNNSC